MATAGVMLFEGPQARWYTQNAVPTQGGAHKRRSVATAGVMLLGLREPSGAIEETGLVFTLLRTMDHVPSTFRFGVGTCHVCREVLPLFFLFFYMSRSRGGSPSQKHSTRKMVHTQRGAYRGRHTQKGGLWPPQESCYLRGHMQGGTHKTRCLHKAVHTKGGLWPPQESCYLRGHRQGGTHKTRCLHKAVHTKRRSVATAGVMLFKGPQARWYTQNAVPTQGGAHKKAACGHRRSHVI